MRSDWIEVSVENIKAPSPNALSTGPFGSSISSRFFQDNGVPVIRGSNLSEDIDKRLVPENTVFISKEKAKEFSRSIAKRGDLVFTCWGTIGQVGLIDERSKYLEYIISNKQMKLTPDPEKVNSLFLYYLFSGPEMFTRIKNQAIGSSVPGFNLGQLRTLKFFLPPLDEQKAIAHILGTLDDKIELNRQMNDTLEAIARALFKSWFIDFDPVRAKIEGRQPAGMDAETAALFPAEFEDSALGKIPKGWQALPFEELFLIPLRNGLTKPKKVRGSGTYMVNMGELFVYRRIGDIEMDRVPLSKSEAEISMVQTVDLLFARQSLVWSGAGQCSIVTEAKEPRTFESHLIRCRINPDKAEPWFYFYYFWSTKGRGRIESLIEQVAAAGIRGADLAKLRVLAPPKKIQRCFREIVQSLESKFSANENESRTLASIRGTLLPKLLSGEIRIKDAEKVVEEMV